MGSGGGRTCFPTAMKHDGVGRADKGGQFMKLNGLVYVLRINGECGHVPFLKARVGSQLKQGSGLHGESVDSSLFCSHLSTDACVHRGQSRRVDIWSDLAPTMPGSQQRHSHGGLSLRQFL